MTRIRYTGLGLLHDIIYHTPKGNKYMFYSNQGTEVPDKDDAKFFLENKTGLFVKEGNKKVGSDGAPAVKKKKDQEIIESEKVTIYTESELFDLDKDEQVALIKKLTGDEKAKIPRYERGRVDLILKIQEQVPSVGDEGDIEELNE